MKLIQEYSSEFDAESASEKLRKRGILTHISSVQSHRLSSIKTGTLKVGLWVVLNNQYRDGCKILAKKQCKVRNPLSEEQMREIERENANNAPGLLLSFLLKGLFVLVCIVGLVLFLIVDRNA